MRIGRGRLRLSLEQKNALFVVGLVVTVLVGVSLLGYVLTVRQVRAEAARDLTRARQGFSAESTRILQALSRGVRAMAARSALDAAGGRAGRRETLRETIATLEVDLAALDPGGAPGGTLAEGSRPRFAAPAVLAAEPLRELVGEARRGGAVVARLVAVYGSVFAVAAAPTGPGERPVLVLGEALTAEDLGRLRELLGTELILYRQGAVLASTLAAAPAARDLPAGAGDVAALTINGTRYLARSYGVEATPPLHALFAYPAERRWAPYGALARQATSFVLAILLAAALLGIAVSRLSLTRPIRRLAAATRRLRDGDFEVKVDDRRSDELGDLARAFKEMGKSLRASQAELELSRRRFHDFAQSSSDWLWETDRDARFHYVSPSIVASTGYTPKQLTDRRPDQVFAQDDLSELMTRLRPEAKEVRPFKGVECWLTHRDGHRQCLRFNAVPIGQGATFRGFRGTASDVTKAKVDEERLVSLANQDHLTGLANRRRFLADLAHEIRRAEANGSTGALLLLDLDHFKLINDTAGHAAGDRILVEIAAFLRRQVRAQDLVARLSGDEFALAFPDMDGEAALSKAQGLLEEMARLKPLHGGKAMSTSASIGIVTFPADGTDPVALLALADTAMYAGKAAGRNRAHLYREEDMACQRMDTQLTWKDRIQQALDDDRFVLAYQPVVAASGGRPRRYEVLVRMRTRDGRLHPPGAFIPTAEQFGQIRELDRLVVAKAIAALAEPPADQRSLRFSVNLSGLSVGDPVMRDLIEREIGRHGLDASRVVFEITESAAVDNLSSAIDFIGHIKGLGCRIALDDFGVGFSSFAYLKHLRVDVLKIDASFVRNVHQSTEDRLFVKALVDVARGMGIQTVAEGVETAEVHEAVRGLGVDYLQGYYIGRPQLTLEPRVGSATPPAGERG